MRPQVRETGICWQLRMKSYEGFDSLVVIKPTGDKTPLYIVHGFGMNVLLFNNIAKNMDPEQPVYALQAKGLNTNQIDDSLDRMEDIAAYYISEIIAQNPDGNLLFTCRLFFRWHYCF